MPATSQQQQKLFGLALAVKRGEVSASEVSDEVNAIVDRMSEKDIEDFAGTKHDGLPKKVEAQLREIVREIMRERAMKEAELPKAMIPNNIKAKLNMAIDKIKDTNLTYNQKLQVIGKIIDSLGIDKKELVKMSTRLKGTLESVTEGKKVFSVNPGIGKVKYSISSHDGVKKHKDGSDFYDIKTFKNKVDLEKAIKDYTSKGFKMESVNEAKNDDKYVVIDFHEKGGGFVMTKPGSKKDAEDSARSIRKGSDISKREVLKVSDARKIRGLAGKNYLNEESVNEARVSIEAASVANLTGTRNLAVQDFIDAHNLDARKLYKHIKSGSLKDRLEFVTALAGKPGNPIQTKVIKMFGESVVNEGFSTEEKRIVLMAVKKISKYMNVDLPTAMNYLLGAGQELERDIKKGKIK